ncbi:hypothetical protein [Phenylobacterium sp.]|uniref:hypothetical protein n=1 Tax=Phenylobacterium sp. TaxID=1871053 RepID=UPI00121473AB|nr:hypothetical protein [Phenylobacterium sp.]THD64036.1 MAG: hypothetical protein E8A49_03295 [Phenylobacterium sp.]
MRAARGDGLSRSAVPGSRAILRPAAIASVLAVLALAAPAAAQLPRAADGHPDLSGVWTNASVTHLTRMPGVKGLVVTAEEAKKLAANSGQVRRQEADAKPSNAAAGAPGEGDPGGYNAYWLDPGATLGEVKGQFRTSWIVDPADGELPLTAEGKRRVAEANAYARRADTPDGPDSFEPWDRCIIGSRGSGGPGMLNNIYNSNYQIVQTPGSVAIVVEMIHDARTIPLFKDKATAEAAHGPATLHPWLGDAVGWWEGDTLVVETVNVNAEQGRAGPIYLTPQAKVTERFTRVSAKQIFYEFRVEDPVYYTQPWRAEMSLNAIAGQVYEYACHEGNYALEDILKGMRAGEATRGGKGGQ